MGNETTQAQIEQIAYTQHEAKPTNVKVWMFGDNSQVLQRVEPRALTASRDVAKRFANMFYASEAERLNIDPQDFEDAKRDGCEEDILEGSFAEVKEMSLDMEAVFAEVRKTLPHAGLTPYDHAVEIILQTLKTR
jgi:hypothetical protein